MNCAPLSSTWFHFQGPQHPGAGTIRSASGRSWPPAACENGVWLVWVQTGMAEKGWAEAEPGVWLIDAATAW